MNFDERFDHIDTEIVRAMADVRRYQEEGYHSGEELRVFMQQMNLRHDRIHEQQILLVRQAITEGREHAEEQRRTAEEQRRTAEEQRRTAEERAKSDDEARAEARAQRGALFAILDRLNPQPPPEAA